MGIQSQIYISSARGWAPRRSRSARRRRPHVPGLCVLTCFGVDRHSGQRPHQFVRADETDLGRCQPTPTRVAPGDSDGAPPSTPLWKGLHVAADGVRRLSAGARPRAATAGPHFFLTLASVRP